MIKKIPYFSGLEWPYKVFSCQRMKIEPEPALAEIDWDVWLDGNRRIWDLRQRHRKNKAGVLVYDANCHAGRIDNGLSGEDAAFA